MQGVSNHTGTAFLQQCKRQCSGACGGRLAGPVAVISLAMECFLGKALLAASASLCTAAPVPGGQGEAIFHPRSVWCPGRTRAWTVTRAGLKSPPLLVSRKNNPCKPCSASLLTWQWKAGGRGSVVARDSSRSPLRWPTTPIRESLMPPSRRASSYIHTQTDKNGMAV